MKKLITIFTLLVLLVSCDNAKDIVLDKPIGKLSEEQISMIKSDLSEEEKKTLMRYEVRRTLAQAFRGADMETLTIGEAIDAQEAVDERLEEKQAEELKAQEVERDQLAEQEAIRDAKLAKLRKTYKFELLSKKLTKKNYQTYNFMRIRIQNHGDVGIRAIAYDMVLDDLFGDNIATLGFKCSTPIDAKRQFDAEYNVPYNRFESKDKDVANTIVSNMRITFVPTKIILEDGNTIEL